MASKNVCFHVFTVGKFSEFFPFFLDFEYSKFQRIMKITIGSLMRKERVEDGGRKYLSSKVLLINVFSIRGDSNGWMDVKMQFDLNIFRDHFWKILWF